jgi:predicted MPP superfamily phosphohydrolase
VHEAPALAAGDAHGQGRREMERVKRAFFRSFFRLLLGVVALAEWACVAWTLHAVGRDVPAWLHAPAIAAVFLVNRWVVLHRRGSRPMPRLVARAVPVYASMAFTTVFCALVLAVAGVVWAVGRLAGLPLGAGEPLARAYFWVVNLGIGTVVGLFLHGYTAGQRALTLTRLTVRVPGLPAPLAGLRIVHLSDLHIGTYLAGDELAEHVRRVNALAPDVIVVTGDLVDRAETCADGFPVLAGLRARHGVFVTLGNHDFAAGAAEVTAALRRLTPFTVLRDARADVVVDGAVLPLLGLDDLGRDWARGVFEHPGLVRLGPSVPRGMPFVVLSHRPDCFAQAVRAGAALMLAGHTHGGQLALPAGRGRVRNLAEFITPFSRGLYRIGDATLYVNRGLGFTAQKIRVFTPREIAVVELAAT